MSGFLYARPAGHPPAYAARAGAIAGAYAYTEPGTGTALIGAAALEAALASPDLG
ncbi:MAG: hypothetical protein GEV11_19545 [Streptosporangiales bacterium]|nr:hypothetical protein [Streptosporangiales bacterium]